LSDKPFQSGATGDTPGHAPINRANIAINMQRSRHTHPICRRRKRSANLRQCWNIDEISRENPVDFRAKSVRTELFLGRGNPCRNNIMRINFNQWTARPFNDNTLPLAFRAKRIEVGYDRRDLLLIRVPDKRLSGITEKKMKRDAVPNECRFGLT
jgi:hypothetical protein